MNEINDYMFVFYWRPKDEEMWSLSQPISLGEIIDGSVELEFMNGETLPIGDINWSKDEVKVAKVPPRKYVHYEHTSDPSYKGGV